MTPEDVLAALQRPHVSVKRSWGETALFVNPEGQLKSGAYFATIKEKDGENDWASNLDRPGIWRLNFGTPPRIYEERLGPRPKRPAKGAVVEGPWDFTAIDTPMPHPVYAWMGWMAVLNPSAETFAALMPAIDAAYEKALSTAQKRIAKGG